MISEGIFERVSKFPKEIVTSSFFEGVVAKISERIHGKISKSIIEKVFVKTREEFQRKPIKGFRKEFR